MLVLSSRPNCFSVRRSIGHNLIVLGVILRLVWPSSGCVTLLTIHAVLLLCAHICPLFSIVKPLRTSGVRLLGTIWNLDLIRRLEVTRSYELQW